jgi:hypothetical protein
MNQFADLFFIFFPVIVKATNGPRYVVGCRRQVCAITVPPTVD